jgi:hypothetical protein
MRLRRSDDPTAPRAHALLCAAAVKTLRSINDLAIAGFERIDAKVDRLLRSEFAPAF